jgi:hypothetical protein
MLQTRRPGFDPQQGQGFTLWHRRQTESGAYPSSYPMGTGGSFPGDKVARSQS